jgi:hypothetical protein
MSYALHPAGAPAAEKQVSLVGIGDTPNLDAFSRLRISGIDTIFDSSFQYDLQPLIYEAKVANNGAVAHDADKVSALVSVAAQASSSAILQSKQYHRYIPGKSQLVVMTQILGAATANVVKRVGYFDAENGIFLEQNGTTDLAVVRRTSVGAGTTDNRVIQADWNLDRLDGTGPSGLTLDLSKASIFIIDLQWLGMGRVRVGFDIDGQIDYVHEFLNANILDVPYMQTANLPIRWEVTGSAVGSLLATCASVNSEGGADKFFGYQFAYSRASVTAASGVATYGFSIRPKATFNSITNRMWIRPIAFDCLVTGNQPVLLEIYYGTAVGGTPSWGDMNATYSGLQVDTAGTPSGGLKVAQIYIAATAQNKGEANKLFSARYPLTLDVAGTGYNHMTVYVTGVGGDSACRPGLSWEEVR